LVEGILAGRSAVSGLPPSEPPVPGRAIAPALAARVRQVIEPGRLSPSSWRRLDRCSRMAAVAASEALGLPDGGAAAGGDGCGMVLGTMGAGVEPLREFLTPLFRDGPDAVSPMIFPSTLPSAPASQCSILLGLRGPHLTVCQMEASGLGAIATAVSILESGAAEAMIAGGVDELPAEVERAWRRWGILARGEAAEFRGPFDRRRRGFAPGEGAYVLLLETLDAAHRRGAAAWAEVAGAAMAHARGAPHRWPEEPDVVARSMTLALQRAGLAASEIGYVAASADGGAVLDAVAAWALPAAP